MTAAPEFEFFERLHHQLDALGVITRIDDICKPTPFRRPPTVVVERLDTIKKWAWSFTRVEVARELDDFAERLEQLSGEFSADAAAALIVAALRDRAEALRSGAVAP